MTTTKEDMERFRRAIHSAIGDFALEHINIRGKSANDIADDILAEADKAFARAKAMAS